MPKFTEDLDDRSLFITDQLDIHSVYTFGRNQENIYIETVSPHSFSQYKPNSLGICIKNNVYKNIIQETLQMDQITWLASQVRYNRVKLAPGKEIVMIVLHPGYMQPVDCATAQFYYEQGCLCFLSVSQQTPSYQRVLV